MGESGIVSGDNCTLVGTILVPSGEGDMGEYISGLERIRSMEPKVLFPGHGPLIANPKRLLTEYIEHRKARHERVLKAVQDGNSKLANITAVVYADTPDAHPILAQDQVLSHLKELIRTKHVEWRENTFHATLPGES